MKLFRIEPFVAVVALVFIPGIALAADQVTGTDLKAVVAELKASFTEKGDVKLDRIDQSPMQKACSLSAMTGKPLSKEELAEITQHALASVKQPADGQYLGNWKAGEKIAQSGRGLQFSDKPGAPSGGNCYACHQMTKSEISFGNIGPSLLHYGAARGSGKEMLVRAWNQVYNSHSYNACSTMPRFGAAGILTETQLKDVMALLFDPKSPVNDDSVKP